MRASQVQEELNPHEVLGTLAVQPRHGTSPPPSHKSHHSRHSLIVAAGTRNVFKLIDKLGKVQWPVLLRAEPGSGTEVLARAIHNASRTGPFIVIDGPPLRSQLTDSELFGIVRTKNSKTGSGTKKLGLIEMASNGTAFFDRIDALPFELQAKLVRAFRERQFYSIGSASPRKLDARIIAATNRDLAKEVEAGRFRRDLYELLSVVDIRLAPLRERKEQIPTLVNHFLSGLSGNYSITKQAMAVILLYDWPGNVRELESCVQYMAAASTDHHIDLKDFPPNIQAFLGDVEGELLSDFSQGNFEQKSLERVSSEVPGTLWTHAIETFGSSSLATEWFLAECGALDNRAPLDIVRGEEGRDEVDRILGCIDHGMIA